MFQSPQRAAATVGVLLVSALLTLRFLSRDSALGRAALRSSYDGTLALAALWDGPLSDCPVAIVYLDLESYSITRQNPGAPWDRALHARLLQRLTRAGAKAVVFDIIFDAPGPDSNADRAFAAALRENHRTILAAELDRSGHSPLGDGGTKNDTLVLPQPMLRAAAAGWGIATFEPDEDFVVRRLFPGFLAQNQPSLAWAAARLLRLPEASTGAPQTGARWIRYRGRPLTIPHISYHTALEPNGVTDAFFRNRVVFVGARPRATTLTERRDEFRSPFRSWPDTELFMPAVEVHATEMLDLLRGDSLRRLDSRAEAVLLLLVAVAWSWGLFQLRPLAAATWALAGEFGLLGLAVIGCVYGGTWFPWLIVSAVQIPLAFTGSVLFQSVDWYRQRRKAQRQIKEQAALIDKAQDAIIVQDLWGQITYANPSAIRLYGWALPELRRPGASERLFSPAAGAAAQALRVTMERGEWAGELVVAPRSGKHLTMSARWTLIKDEQGQPQSLLLVHTDVTERKQLEAQVLRTQRMETMGALASGMAHDLNNALAPVLMGIQLLHKKPSDPETGRILQVMESNTLRGADMVRQVLLFSRGREGERKPVDLGSILREIERLARQTFSKGISTAAMAPADLWPVLGDSTQLHQLLLNLCVNARDGMPGGGTLTLAADNLSLTSEEAAKIPGARAGEFVSLIVADTGTGIAPELIPHVFEPFFTTKPAGQGTGLGLSTVARLVAGYGGFINLQSKVGEGTIFEICLPRAPLEALEGPTEAATEPPRGREELLLLVDDELALLEMTAPVLTDHGYRVMTSGDGAEALLSIEQHRGEVSLVLLDWELPILDGRKTLEAIHANYPTIPVILMSGNAVSAEALGLSPGQVAGVLHKPYGLVELLNLIATTLRSSRDSSASP